MKRFLFLILFLGLILSAFGQSQTLSAPVGTFTFSGFSSGGTSDVTGTLSGFNDQTNQYFGNSVQVGDIVWDNLGRRWEIVAINSQNLTQVQVDMRDINASGATPSGVGFISRETPNFGFSLFVPDNNIGISQQLKSRVESHNFLLLDQVLNGIQGADTLTVLDGATVDLEKSGVQELTAEVIISPDAGNIVEALANGIFADVQDIEVTLNKQIIGALNQSVGDVLEILADSMHVHKDGQTVDFSLIQGIDSETFDTVTAEVIVSPDAGNALESRANGLYASGSGGGVSQARDTFYNAGQGFWVYGSLGVTATVGTQGEYTVSIPDSSRVLSMWVEFDQASDLTVGGEAVITINHNTGVYSTSFANALLPIVQIVDSGGVQRNPGDVSVTVTTATPSGGSTVTTAANINGLGYPHRLKFNF